MQRTALKRSGKRLASKSRKNSKPNRDQGIVDAYKAAHPRCAFCRCREVDAHHIFAGRGRWDRAANLICLCRTHHEEMHREPSAGKIECMYWKLTHGEFDADTLTMVSGERLAGWLSRHRPGAMNAALCHQWFRVSEETNRV